MLLDNSAHGVLTIEASQDEIDELLDACDGDGHSLVRNDRQPGPNPRCCSHADAMCDKCKAMGGHGGSTSYLGAGVGQSFGRTSNYKPSPLGQPTMNFGNNVESDVESEVESDDHQPAPAIVLNGGVGGGIGQPIYNFDIPASSPSHSHSTPTRDGRPTPLGWPTMQF